MNTSDLELLKLEIEKKMGGAIQRQNEVRLLQNAIEIATDKKIGFNTLRRLFSFLPTGKPNSQTLQILCEFCGYPSVAAFQIKCRKHSDWYLWKRVYSIENEERLSESDIQWLLGQHKHPEFVYFVSTVLNANFRSRNINNIQHLLSRENRLILTYEDQLKLASSLGLLFRKINLDEFLFLFNSTQLNQLYTFLFVDYSEMNGSYGKVISYLINQQETTQNDTLFIHLIHEYHKYLNGDNHLKLIPKPADISNIHPILWGRWLGYQLISNPALIEEKLLFSLAIKQKSKNHFFYELFPACILTRRIGLLEKIIDKYYEELFENTNWVTYTENCMYLIGYCFVNIKNGKPRQGIRNLAFIDFDQVLDSYKAYIKLFYLIATYQAEMKIGLLENLPKLEQEYLDLSEKMGFKRFDPNLLKNYFN